MPDDHDGPGRGRCAADEVEQPGGGCAVDSGLEDDLKVMATALGAGILLDATVVRALLVPAVVAVLGRWNWWLPAWASRLVRIPVPPAAADPGSARARISKTPSAMTIEDGQ